MSNVASIFSTSNLGKCLFCIRTSFKAAATSWVIALVTAYFSKWPPILVTTFGCSFLLTILWVAHLVTFSMRAATFQNAASNSAKIVFRRRELMPLFVRALAGIVVASALPKVALAYSNYDRNEEIQCGQNGNTRYFCCEVTQNGQQNQVCNCYPMYVASCQQAGYPQ